jgi:predicted  nucleic acid-binding Zn-ribbon protein
MLATPQTTKASLQQRNSKENSISPTCVASEFYAPSRQKRVTFATEVFVKAPPVQLRLQGLSLRDLDHGVSVCRAAIKSDEPEDLPRIRRIRGSKKSGKPIGVLERRLDKIERQYVEASFEVKVGQNEMHELMHENEMLKRQLKRFERMKMGYDNLEDSIEEMGRKIRKYSSKIAKLQKAMVFYNAESDNMFQQLQQLKTLGRRRSSKDRIRLETIPE